jgi:hypothetical protein
MSEIHLKKAKTNKAGGLYVEYSVEHVIGDEVFESTVKRNEDIPPHPDLTSIFEELKPMLTKVFEYKKDKANVKVIGISFSGSDDTAGAVITGTFKTSGGQKVALNTPRLRYNVTTYGYEEQLEAIHERLEQEVKEYLFEEKKAQLEIGLE